MVVDCHREPRERHQRVSEVIIVASKLRLLIQVLLFKPRYAFCEGTRRVCLHEERALELYVVRIHKSSCTGTECG
jgi:hypothetical protein